MKTWTEDIKIAIGRNWTKNGQDRNIWKKINLKKHITSSGETMVYEEGEEGRKNST